MNEALLYKDKLKQLLEVKAQDDLMYFVPFLNQDFQSPRHLKQLIDKLQSIIDGNVERFTISAPPQIGKSESIFHFIALALKKNPKLKIIYSSFNEAQAVSRVFKAYEYAKKLGIELSNKWETKNEWRTTQGGGVFATGLRAGAVGRSVDIWIIDDPYGGIDDSRSKVYNDMVNNYFLGTVQTRLRKTTSLIVMHTRWNKNDLIGTLKEKGYDSIDIKAIQVKDGKEVSIDENLISLEELKKIRQANPKFFEANYQQTPIEDIGGYFQLQTKTFTEVKDLDYEIWGADFAYSEGQGDYTVLVKIGYKDGKFYVLDFFRKQISINETVEVINNIVGENELLVEDNGVQKGINDLVRKNSTAFIMRRKIQGSKLTRATNLISQWNLGNIYLRDNKKEIYSELYAFDGEGKGHDDIIDAMSLAINEIIRYV